MSFFAAIQEQVAQRKLRFLVIGGRPGEAERRLAEKIPIEFVL